MKDDGQGTVLTGESVASISDTVTLQTQQASGSQQRSVKSAKYSSNETTCPCCNQKVQVNRPVVDLNTNTISFRGWLAKVRPLHAELMFVLSEAWPRTVNNADMASRLWGDSDSRSSDHMSTLKTTICQLRRLLPPEILRIETVQRTGYRIVL